MFGLFFPNGKIHFINTIYSTNNNLHPLAKRRESLRRFASGLLHLPCKQMDY